MKLLLDAHALIWAVDRPSTLSDRAYDALSNPAHQLFISSITIWEISIKCGIGKLILSQSFRPWIEQAIHDLGAQIVELTIAAADLQMQLPKHHGDPFDRMLIAQSQVEPAVIVSRDGVFDQYEIQRVW